jgi:hypothetical protein
MEPTGSGIGVQWNRNLGWSFRYPPRRRYCEHKLRQVPYSGVRMHILLEPNDVPQHDRNRLFAGDGSCGVR